MYIRYLVLKTCNGAIGNWQGYYYYNMVQHLLERILFVGANVDDKDGGFGGAGTLGGGEAVGGTLQLHQLQQVLRRYTTELLRLEILYRDWIHRLRNNQQATNQTHNKDENCI